MIMPLPFTWPLGIAFWLVLFWGFWPELRILREARRSQRAADAATHDPSFGPLVMGQRFVMLLAVTVAMFVPRLAMHQYRVQVYVAGLLILIGSSLLRRHCFRMLGADFQGAVRVRPDQPVIDHGAYRFLRHPS